MFRGFPEQGGDPVTELEVFHFEDGKQSFEDFGHTNGQPYWWQSDLQQCLGYKNPNAFRTAVGRAMTACNALGVDLGENFIAARRKAEDGGEVSDTKLSRFACYLIAMNADPRKPEVAKAQVYFATLAQAAESYLAEVEGVERVTLREDISDGERSLAGAAKVGGVREYALFQNAGYRGLYNMDLRRIRSRKGVPDRRSLLDFMGKEEMAANLFRITQTESKIKNERIRGQWPLEAAAETVGRQVRKTIEEIGGTMPEDLLPAEDVKQVEKRLKQTRRHFKKLDGRVSGKQAKIVGEMDEPDADTDPEA